MTRDEAQQRIDDYKKNSGSNHILDILETLGLLTFDAPKGPNERAVDAMFSFPLAYGGMITPRHAIQAIHDAGLKIVED